MKIGILSDTHGFMDERILHHLSDCTHIIHAGDIGNLHVMNQLEAYAPCTTVYGNIDNSAARVRYPEHTCWSWDSLTFILIHIAGALGKYNQKTRLLIDQHQPDVLICGHSHILKVKQDDRFNLLHINPGAAGRHGFHKVRTLLTVELLDGQLKDMKVVELGPRSARLA